MQSYESHLHFVEGQPTLKFTTSVRIFDSPNQTTLLMSDFSIPSSYVSKGAYI